VARILIIDDDDALRAAMSKILEREGHEVRAAADGDTGLSLHRSDPADLVVTDLIMPEKEGIETLQDLRAEFPDVPILAISGGGAVGPAGPLTDATLLGADAALAKPFAVDVFVEAVARLLGEGGDAAPEALPGA
jgi:DNA-binding response OmpR family regulator